MKTLYLFRHAKSSWDDASLADFDRPLNERGEDSALLMGKVMRKRKVRPGLIVCSPAERTRRTAKIAFKAARVDVDITFDQQVYLASAKQLLKVLSLLKDSVESVILIGHNPGLEDLLERLTGQFERFPTAALAELELNIDRWRSLQEGCGQIIWLIRPREITK
jgi:phosphohistidine phosphatase